MTNTNSLLQLNPIESFLKNFLEKFPSYQDKIITPDRNEHDYNYLLHLLEQEWKQKFPDNPFFLNGSSTYLSEDFFIPHDKNVCVLKNLCYMPLLLHSHQFIEINYVMKSDSSIFIDNETSVSLMDGDIILCPPGLSHTFCTHNSGSIIIDLIIRTTTFDTAFFPLLNNNNYLATIFSNAIYGASNGYIIWHCHNDTTLENLILEIYREWQNSLKYNDQMIELLVMEFILKLMRSYENNAFFSTSYMNRSDESFRAFLNYMQIHYQHITLSQLASSFNYSERQVIRILKKNTNKGFSELLLEIRMNKALQLLKNPDIPITSIASMLGYSSTYYFSKVFLETFTFTPTAFRERLSHNT